MIEIEHCPFCKNSTGFSVILPYEEYPGHVRCLSCGAETPFDTWNNRPTEKELRSWIIELEAENKTLVESRTRSEESVHVLMQLIDELRKELEEYEK